MSAAVTLPNNLARFGDLHPALDAQSAVAWAQEHGKKTAFDKEGKPAEEGNQYLVGVISGLAQTSLDQAARLAQDEPRSRARGEMMDKVLDAYFKQRSPEAARDWVAGLPEGTFRDGIMRRVVRGGAMAEVIDRWSEKNPNEAGTWLGKFPASPEADDPRQSFAWNIRDKDPESALAWARTLSDEKRQTKLTYDLVRNWMKRDSNGAKTWIQNNNALTPELRAKLLN